MLVRLNEPLLSPQEETGRSGAESIQNPGDLTLGSRGDDSQKVWAAVPKWVLGNGGRLPTWKHSLKEPDRMVENQVSSVGIPRPQSRSTALFLFIDPTPGTPATKEKAEVSEICQHMT